MEKGLVRHCEDSKAATIALGAIARDCFARHGLDWHWDTLTDLCAAADLARASVYEQRASLINDFVRQGAVASPARINRDAERTIRELQLSVRVLTFRLEHPGALIVNATGRATYSQSFKRMILDEDAKWEDSDDAFVRGAGIPTTTLWNFRREDAQNPITPETLPKLDGIKWPGPPNDLVASIAVERSKWHGPLSGFFSHVRKKFGVGAKAVSAILRICDQLPTRTDPEWRYRGDTQTATPGAIIVTDGMELALDLGDGRTATLNWQGTVDQATACHVAVVVTPTESAASVRAAYDQATALMGRAPLGLVHDNKPLHQDRGLRAHVGAKTEMIAGTLGRGQSKAVVEGEFGKFSRDVGTLHFDTSSMKAMIESAAREAIRAYTAGINHAPREEFGGMSRIEKLRESCPDPVKDRDLVMSLKGRNAKNTVLVNPLRWQLISRQLLDAAYERFGLTSQDPASKQRFYLASNFEPEAVRTGVALFAERWEKGKLTGKHTQRYLVAVIKSAQIEIDLARNERWLLEYAERERAAWIEPMREEYDAVIAEKATPVERALDIADHALFASIVLERPFWEGKLIDIMRVHPELNERVATHIRRRFEAPADHRRQLLGRIITCTHGLDRVVDRIE